MFELIRSVWMRASASTKKTGREGKVMVYDSNGHAMFLDRGDVQAAIQAELIDAASALEDEVLVYEEGWTWPIDLSGLRGIIAIAHNEPNPDLALLDVVLARGFHEYKPDEDDVG